MLTIANLIIAAGLIAGVGGLVAAIRDFPGFDFWGWVEAEAGRDLRPAPRSDRPAVPAE